jgi:pyridoxal biosynthesis lyase PdxS
VEEARLLEEIGVDLIDESEVLTPVDEKSHIDKWVFKVPFVNGLLPGSPGGSPRETTSGTYAPRTSRRRL